MISSRLLIKSLSKQTIIASSSSSTTTNSLSPSTPKTCNSIYISSPSSSSSIEHTKNCKYNNNNNNIDYYNNEYYLLSTSLCSIKRYCTTSTTTSSKISIPLDQEEAPNMNKKKQPQGDNLCTPPSQQQQNIDNDNVNSQATSSSTSTSSNTPNPTESTTTAPSCWCLINCKLKDKCINVSMVKPIVYEAEKGYILGEYKVDYDRSGMTSKSRKKVIDACVRENNIYIDREKRRLAEMEDDHDDDDDDDDDNNNDKKKEDNNNDDSKIELEDSKDKEQTIKKEEKKERKETKKLFKTEEEKEALARKYPVLNDELTSIGPIHVIYKNEWITTVVEKIEIENKDYEPYFVLKLMTPIRRTNRLTFEIESLSYFSSIEKLLSFNKSVECSDKEFEKMFITKSSDKVTKLDTKWMMEKRPYLREALMTLKTTLLPSLGFGNSGIELTLSKEEVVKCREGNTQLEFPTDTYQLCLEIDSKSSIWNKDPQSIEKILYLYTVILDSIVSVDGTVDIPIDQTYL